MVPLLSRPLPSVYLVVLLLCVQLEWLDAAIVRNTTTFNNIEFTARGYDILFANPLSTSGIDPGYRLPIFTLSVAGANTLITDDQKYLLPAGVNAYESVSCRLDWQTSVFSTMSSYMNNLQASVSVSGSYNGLVVGGSFSASVDYQSIRNSLSEGSSAFAQTSASCSVYTVELHNNSLPALDSYFVSEVLRVAAKGWYTDDDMLSLIRQFGTHFPTSTTMGARFGQQSQMKSSYYNSQSTSSIKTSAELSVSTAASSVSASMMYSDQVDQAESFSSNCTSQSIFTVGSAPPSDGSALTWASKAFDNPAPIRSSGFLPITTLMTTQYIPSGDSGHLSSLVANLNPYLQNKYCQSFGSDCNGITVTDDRCFGGWFVTSSQLYGGYTRKNPLINAFGCPLGFNAINVGAFYYCINSDRSQCYVGARSVSSFGGFYTTTDYRINPWTQQLGCTSDMTAYKFFLDIPNGLSRDVYICLSANTTGGGSIIGGSYGLSTDNTKSVTNPWPIPNADPLLYQCPLGYGTFLLARVTSGISNMDRDWYICLLTATPFFQRFQLSEATSGS